MLYKQFQTNLTASKHAAHFDCARLYWLYGAISIGDLIEGIFEEWLLNQNFNLRKDRVILASLNKEASK